MGGYAYARCAFLRCWIDLFPLVVEEWVVVCGLSFRKMMQRYNRNGLFATIQIDKMQSGIDSNRYFVRNSLKDIQFCFLDKRNKMIAKSIQKTACADRFAICPRLQTTSPSAEANMHQTNSANGYSCSVYLPKTVAGRVVGIAGGRESLCQGGFVDVEVVAECIE